MREHLETFLAQVQAKTGTGLPEFLKDEFEAVLECGVLAHGFLRVHCADCTHERLAASRLIWLALRNITADWSRAAHNWKAAMNQFAILYQDRFTRQHG